MRLAADSIENVDLVGFTKADNDVLTELFLHPPDCSRTTREDFVKFIPAPAGMLSDTDIMGPVTVLDQRHEDDWRKLRDLRKP
jgi:hypothetical protein